MCFGHENCEDQNNLVECNHEIVEETAYHFRFLPNVMNQVPNEEFYCALYRGILNRTSIELSGCFYGTFNPCAFVSEVGIPNLGYRCKYCNLHDGCNSGSMIGIGVAAIFFHFLKYLT